MRFAALVLLSALCAGVPSTEAVSTEWRAGIVPAPGPVGEVDSFGGEALVTIGKDRYRIATAPLRLEPVAAPRKPVAPEGALPDTRIATSRTIARAWLVEPTRRYAHGVLGDAIEAGGLTIESRDGNRKTLKLGSDAVFEDIEPRIATIGGMERIVVVKSYLDRGSAIAVIDAASASVIGETPPIGRASAWRNPAGIADYDGDGATDIAAVRQPHVVGGLELWSWRDGKLAKTVEVPDVSNHVIGSRAIRMTATADFDGDGRPDLAIPDFSRRTLRLIAFAPSVRDIARVALPARIVTDLALVRLRGRPAILAGLENGQLVLVAERP
ncbi:FG-GAP repeat domain-containing protein [Pseudorhodoplanes sinuspersici]|uniref:Uncharacterized protein n=1 Tax=Pseudorhodoplanes sinuspersici TaxID=1235591 RepID=A0A1W6ZND9_9HYPH|nr:VCBS repeat-containing protein [Pseudorhodoplanes sinuspersici]ARP98832.1 hypothetical protein CAK95_06885 [Pseudorhodoplanes sinuspersici]RKE69552.1 VCBS repeat protein [Pseudorhodoplanes sinuspersici]